jgi:tRNA 2-thiouridine synthesizing protein A
MTNEAAMTIDARGMRCPWPALRLAKALRGRDEAVLLADDPRAEGEIAALAAAKGWQVAVTRDGPIWHIHAHTGWSR